MENNLLIAGWYDVMYQGVIDFLTLLIVCLWLSFINFSYLVSEIDHLFKHTTKRFGFMHLSTYISKPVIGLISGMIPTLLIKGFLALFPLILELIYWKLSSAKDAATVRLQLYNNYYLCLIVMVLLGIAVTEAFTSNIFMKLAVSLESTATFFLQYMMVISLMLDPLYLLYPALYYFTLDCCKIRNKEKKGLKEFDYVF